MTRSAVPVTLVTLFLVALQLSVFSSLRFAGVVVMVVWLWPLCLGLVGRTGLGLWSALVAGVFFDTHTVTPFGLSAVVALVLTYSASRLGKEGVGDLDSAAWWVTPIIAGVGGLAAPALYVVVGVFALNFSLWRNSLAPMMVVNALAFMVLARPVTRLALWSAGLGRSRR